MPLEKNLAIILKANSDKPVGAGILVEHDLVLTCAHVVNIALDRKIDACERPVGELAVKIHAYADDSFIAKVDPGEDAWSDPPATKRFGADLCLLRLSSPPQGVPKASLWVYKNLIQREFRAAGFPQDWKGDL